MERFLHRIGSEDVTPSTGEYLPTYNPVTADPWAEIRSTKCSPSIGSSRLPKIGRIGSPSETRAQVPHGLP
jgi:hypothetical protein